MMRPCEASRMNLIEAMAAAAAAAIATRDIACRPYGRSCVRASEERGGLGVDGRLSWGGMGWGGVGCTATGNARDAVIATTSSLHRIYVISDVIYERHASN